MTKNIGKLISMQLQLTNEGISSITLLVVHYTIIVLSAVQLQIRRATKISNNNKSKLSYLVYCVGINFLSIQQNNRRIAAIKPGKLIESVARTLRKLSSMWSSMKSGQGRGGRRGRSRKKISISTHLQLKEQTKKQQVDRVDDSE